MSDPALDNAKPHCILIPEPETVSASPLCWTELSLCFIACQGLSWFLECLKRDKDDDVAVEFLKETQTGKEPVRTRLQKVSLALHVVLAASMSAQKLSPHCFSVAGL